ncbi:MAG: transcription initiation factor IIB family protein [Candidatus Nanohaloarchaea archaeon]
MDTGIDMSEVDDSVDPGDTIPVKSEQKERADEARCPSCGSTRFEKDEARGELYCKECGTVVDEKMIDFSREWRAFDAEEKADKARSGGSITFTKSDKGMGTKVGSAGELNKMSGEKRGQYYRIRKWDRRAESGEKGLQTALSELQRIVSQLKLPESVYEEAARLTEKAREEEIVKGRGIEPTVAALTFLVARKQEVPRTLEEVAEAAGVDQRKLGKTYRYVARELDMDIRPADPEDFLPRYTSELGFTGEEEARARRIIRRARKDGILAGRSPKSVVAAAFYLVSELEDKELTQKEISEAVGVTEVTVRKNYTEVAEGLGLDI